MGDKMRKLFWWSLGVILFWTLSLAGGLGIFAYAFGYFPAGQEAVKLPELKTFQSKKLGVEFTYPEELKVREKDGVITIEHKINFEHRNPCDDSGRNQKSKEIFDFYVQMVILPLTPTEVFRKEVMQRDEEGVLVGIKNTVRVTYGQLDGFRLYNGSHGCGPYVYLFQLSDEKVLRVERHPAPEFQEVPENEKLVYGRLNQIILPAQEELFFQNILRSFGQTAK